MKTITLILAVCLLSSPVFSQTVRFSNGESVSTEITELKGGSGIDDDAYHLFAHLACEDARQKEIWDSYDGVSLHVTINGQEIDTEGFSEVQFLFSFQAEEGEEYLMTPSIQADIPLNYMIRSVSSIMKPVGNLLVVDFMYDDESIGHGEIQFDVPEFGLATGDFCGLREKYLTNEDDLIKAATDEFNANYAGAEFVYCWLPVAWMESEDEDGKEMYTSVCIIYKVGERYQAIEYTATKPFVNGSFAAIPVLEEDPYGEIQDLHYDCVTSIMK